MDNYRENGVVVEREEQPGEFVSSAQREVPFVGGVCMWARTDNPATLHSPTISASTTQQNIKVVVG